MAFTITRPTDTPTTASPSSDGVQTPELFNPVPGWKSLPSSGGNPQPIRFASNELNDFRPELNQSKIDQAKKLYKTPQQQAILNAESADIQKPRFTITRPEVTQEQPEQKKPVDQTRDPLDPGAIAGSVAAGTVFGAAAPELMQGAGKVIGMIPHPLARAVGGGLQAAGVAAKGGRAAGALAGGAAGATSETAGQLYEEMFGSGMGAEGVRFGAGLGTTETLGGVKSVVKTPIGWLLGKSPGLKNLMSGIKTFPNGDLDPASLNKLSNEAWDAIRKLPIGDSSQAETLTHLKTGIANDRSVADAEAKRIISEAEAKAQRLVNESPESASAIMRDANVQARKIQAEAIDRQNKLTRAAQNLEEQAQRITAKNVGQLETVGTRLTRTPDGQVTRLTKSDIGDSLRTPIVQNLEADLKARSEAYKTANEQVMNVVQAKEAAGVLPKDTQAYKDLMGEIKDKLLKTSASKGKGTSSVTDKAAINLYEDVQSAVEGRKIAVRDENGEITGYKTYPSTFEAIDYLRKKWGTASKFGQNVEGFSAEQKGIATNLYDKLDKIQSEYVGNDLWRGQQSKYAEMTGDIKSKYYTKSGQKITARDEFNQEQFLQDPSKIPETYFGSRDKVRQLVELTGNRQVVEQEASKYLSMLLEGRSAKDAKNILNDKAELLKEFPELGKRANSYVQQLEQSKSPIDLMAQRKEAIAEAQRVREQAGALSGKAREEARARATASTEQLLKDASRIREEGAGGAKAVIDAHQKVVDSILTSDTPHEVVKRILTEDPTGKMRVVAKLLGNTPKGQEAFANASRQVIANMTPQRLETYWPQVLKGAMKDSGIIGEAELNKLDQDIAKAISTFKGSTRERQEFKKRLLINGVGLYTANVGGRVVGGD